jgi:hypothetical protein
MKELLMNWWFWQAGMSFFSEPWLQLLRTALVCLFLFLITGTVGFTGGYFKQIRTVATAPENCPDMSVPVSNIWKTGVDTCK